MNYGTLISKPHKSSTEVVGKRTENSKTFQNPDGTFTWGGIIGAIHYKEDYQSKTEGWKEIDTDHTVDYPDYVLYDRLPIKVKVFKNKTGYEIESRRTGHKFTVELTEVGGKAKTKHDNSDDLEFEFQIEPDRVRLWKYLKTSKAPKTFKWKVTEENHKEGLYSLSFRENPEAVEIGDKSKAVEVATKKTQIDSASFYWEETASKTGVSIDTDVNEQVGANGDGGYENGTSFYSTSPTYWCGAASYFKHAFARFQTVNVPAGSTISSVTMQLKSWGDNFSATSWRIYGDDVDDSVAPTTRSELTGLTKTTNYVTWSISSTTDGSWYTSPNLGNGANSPIGEVLTRGGWSANNDLTVIGYNYANSYGRYYDYEGGSANAPKLTITYTASASGPANLKTFDGLAKASVKTINGLAIASVKSVDGLT